MQSNPLWGFDFRDIRQMRVQAPALGSLLAEIKDEPPWRRRMRSRRFYECRGLNCYYLNIFTQKEIDISANPFLLFLQSIIISQARKVRPDCSG